MIKSLKRKLLLIMVTCYTAIIIVFSLLVIIAPEREKRAEIRSLLDGYITRHNINSETTPMPNDSPKRDVAPYFDISIIVVNSDMNNTITSWSSDRQGYYNEENIEDIFTSLIARRKDFDYYKGYYYIKHITPDGFSLTILDDTASLHDFNRTISWALIGASSSWILLFILSLKIVSMITSPLEEAFEKQNRFIADSSHELKTPIAIIQANADVLEKEVGVNKWLGYIKTETHKMDKLVKDLTFLASIIDKKEVQERIDFSSLTEGTVLPFEALAFEKKIIIEANIEKDIFVTGSYPLLEKLLSILISNAIKYGEEGGLIKISLEEKHKEANLKVYNTGLGVKKEDLEKIFERFYRTDKARSRDNGSFGLGLAMAKTIAEKENARLSVDSEYGKWIEFSFTKKIAKEK